MSSNFSLEGTGARFFSQISASNGATEISLRAVVEHYSCKNGDNSILNKIQFLPEVLGAFDLEIVPTHSTGDLDTVRTLRAIQKDVNEAVVLSEIESGEQDGLEFKASLYFDHKKAQHAPGLTTKEYKNIDLAWAVLKEICAFLNSEGGILYIGIGNDASVVGLEYDFSFCKQGAENIDGWQLLLQDLLTTAFLRYAEVSTFVNVQCLKINGKFVARVSVNGRRKLSFIKERESEIFQSFRRQGNTTRELKIEEIEGYIDSRSKKS